MEKTQKGDCEITEWIIWYLDCLLRSVEQSDETLSKVLNKAIFWQTHAETVLSERQREVLNLYLDGYPGKLTAKNWAKRVKVSPDTAARDIKDLVEKVCWFLSRGGFVTYSTESGAVTLSLSSPCLKIYNCSSYKHKGCVTSVHQNRHTAFMPIFYLPLIYASR